MEIVNNNSLKKSYHRICLELNILYSMSVCVPSYFVLGYWTVVLPRNWLE